MKVIKAIASVAMAVAVTAAPALAQGGPVRGEGPAMGRGMMQGGPAAMARNPVAVVLEHRDELELTAEQVETLQELKTQLEEENGPRWEQLKEAFGDATPQEMTVEERQALRDRMRELEPVRLEIREANRAAMDQVHELLSDVQETALHGIMQRRMGPDGRPGHGMRGRRPGDRFIGAAWRSGFRAGFKRGLRADRVRGPMW